MKESKTSKSLPFNSIDELVEYVDAGNDLSDYLDEMPEAHFDINIKRRKHMVEIDAELASKLREIARQRQTTTEALVDSWLREKVGQA